MTARKELKPPYPRRRVDNPDPTYATFVKLNNGGWVGEDTHVMDLRTKVMDDIVVPGYARRIAMGEIINNPCVYSVAKTLAGYGSYLANQIGLNNTYTGDGGSMTLFQTSLTGVSYIPPTELSMRDTGSMVSEAKFYAIANIDPTPYAFAEDAGEIRETLKFLRKPFSSLLRMGKNFEKEVYKRHVLRNKGVTLRFGKRKLKYHAADVAGAWAEYRFAAAPLVRSAMDALEAATWYEGITPPKRKTARGFVSEIGNDSDLKRYQHGGGAYDDYRRTITHTLDVAAGILYAVSNPIEDLQWRLGMRVKDVPETVWQLMPLSFMLDRFVDISRTIRGITNLLDPQVSVYAGWTTIRDELEQTLRFETQVVPGWDVTVNGDKVTKTQYSYIRDRWIPSLSDTVPSITPLGLVKDATSTLDLIAVTSRLWSK